MDFCVHSSSTSLGSCSLTIPYNGLIHYLSILSFIKNSYFAKQDLVINVFVSPHISRPSCHEKKIVESTYYLSQYNIKLKLKINPDKFTVTDDAVLILNIPHQDFSLWKNFPSPTLFTKSNIFILGDGPGMPILTRNPLLAPFIYNIPRLFFKRGIHYSFAQEFLPPIARRTCKSTMRIDFIIECLIHISRSKKVRPDVFNVLSNNISIIALPNSLRYYRNKSDLNGLLSEILSMEKSELDPCNSYIIVEHPKAPLPTMKTSRRENIHIVKNSNQTLEELIIYFIEFAGIKSKDITLYASSSAILVSQYLGVQTRFLFPKVSFNTWRHAIPRTLRLLLIYQSYLLSRCK